ncbi:hypothetical protein FKP32DRAFT_1561583, partial [Trametes sanguinea]
KVREWLPFRSEFLDELLQFEGCHGSADDGSATCHACHAAGATMRCTECFQRHLFCQECVVRRHQEDLPLHRLQAWDGKKFVPKTLRDLGIVLQLGHADGECASPAAKTRRIVVGDITGVQAVEVRFCECFDEETGDFCREWTQLLRRGWFPATTNRPATPCSTATAFTFRLLDTFQELNFQGKTNLYDFWKTIERLTDNSGAGTFNRYNQLCHVMRLWRHLTMLKRFGRAHDPTGPEGTQAGELALECAACPQPGKNLPDDWESAPPHIKWLYTLFLMMDANFRARCKDRKLDTFELGSGWAYFVEQLRYLAHVEACAHRKEENTCSAEHNAITKAHLRREGYIASGIGAVLCARHALVRKNGAGDLQLGERYIHRLPFLSPSALTSLRGPILCLLISYDIVCQWYKHLFKRMVEDFPKEMQIDRDKVEIRFAIPKKHFRVHGPNHSRFSLNYLPHVGRTYGEGIDTQWGVLNPLALSTREMNPGTRHEVFDDHWGAWNWQKTVNFASFFLHSLEEAHVMKIRQRRAFTDFSATFEPRVLQVWEALVIAWEEDPKNPDPYEEPQTSISYATVKKQLNDEEAIEAQQGKFPAHDVTPGVFLQLGLEIEDQQCVICPVISCTSVTELAEQQEKRNVLMRRIDSWQSVQDMHMPMVAALRASSSSSSSPSSSSPSSAHPSSVLPSSVPKAEDVKLWLPSALPPSLILLESLHGLRKKEARLRLAQLSDSLDNIRRVRRVLAAISDYSKTHVAGSGQRPTTRMQDLYARFRTKEWRAVNRYRAAHEAMKALQPDGDWSSTYRPLLDEDLRGPRKDDDDLDSPRFTSEGRYEISWIWLTPGANRTAALEPGNTASADEFSASMRAEWARSRARANRWEEEEKLLLEEMRRVLEYFKWRASWWREQAERRINVSVELQRGLSAYAEKQAAVFDGLASRCGARWYLFLKTLGPLPDWIHPFAASAKPYRPRRQFNLTSGEVLDSEEAASGESSSGERDADSGGSDME